MHREKTIARISRYAGRLINEVKMSVALSHFNINKVTEDVLVPVLSLIYDCTELKNLNSIEVNFPAIDLGCRKSRRAFQITSTASSDKIIKTLAAFRKHNLSDDFDSLTIFVITERQKTYNSKLLDAEITQQAIAFNTNEHIVDFAYLMPQISALDTVKLEQLALILETEIEGIDKNLKFKNELENFLEVARSKIDVEKNTKKYIPSIFVETHAAKDHARLFAQPVFFAEFVDQAIEKIRPQQMNRIFDLSMKAPLSIEFQNDRRDCQSMSLSELNEYLDAKHEKLVELEEQLNPFKSRESRGTISHLIDENTYDLFDFHVTNGSNSIIRKISQARDLTTVTKSKILLVTGMAGQGKTNFVCDLIENQFQKFRTPCIFIPARNLNSFPAGERIFKYIQNNRFAPDGKSLHQLFATFESVAKEQNKVFVVVIDGMNEVRDLESFEAELIEFFHALCQYDHVRVIATCRSEFFDHRFSAILNQDFSDNIFRIDDLKSEMTELDRSRLIPAYKLHFNITGRLGHRAEEFLEKDLLMLRIFAETNENKNLGLLEDIDRGEIFEKYLIHIATKTEFTSHEQKYIISTLHKIAERMLSTTQFTQITLNDFSELEIGIIEKLVFHDIVLRRELPNDSLINIGSENISFTYDDLRDFIVAHYIVFNLAMRSLEEATEFVSALRTDDIIFEGVFKYVYVLSRKAKNRDLELACEEATDFTEHYIQNLNLISPHIQNSDDQVRVARWLRDDIHRPLKRRLAIFLFQRRNESHLLNTKILISHISELSDGEIEEFLEIMFAPRDFDWANHWQNNINNLTKQIIAIPNEEFDELDWKVLACVLQSCSWANQDTFEQFLNKLSSFRSHANVISALEFCENSKSQRIANAIFEIRSV